MPILWAATGFSCMIWRSLACVSAEASALFGRGCASLLVGNPGGVWLRIRCLFSREFWLYVLCCSHPLSVLFVGSVYRRLRMSSVQTAVVWSLKLPKFLATQLEKKPFVSLLEWQASILYFHLDFSGLLSYSHLCSRAALIGSSWRCLCWPRFLRVV